MGEIAIHGNQDRIPAVVGPGDAFLVGAADPQLSGAMGDKDAIVGAGQPVENVARAVGGMVVHEQDVGVEIQRQELAAHALDVFPLIVGRHENQDVSLRNGAFLCAVTISSTISSNVTEGFQPVIALSLSEFPVRVICRLLIRDLFSRT